MSAKIIIASYTKSLKNTLARNIVGLNIDVKFSFNIVEAASYFSTTEPNILIYDIDNGANPSKYISMLLNKYKLLIILTGANPKRAYDFYSFGIKDYIIKPDNFSSSDGEEYILSIKERIRMFFEEVKRTHKGSGLTSFSLNHQSNRHHSLLHNHKHNYNNISKFGYKNDIVIAIASSTGGTEALDKIVRELPADMPPILVVQHMASSFTKHFAKRLNNFSNLNIKEAEDGEIVYPETLYIAPGDFHMRLVKSSDKLVIRCVTDKKVNGVRPAADVLFESVAQIMGNKAIGVILTGMGSDGAKGLSIMKKAGSINIGQDEETSLVYGMPRVAYELGCIDEQLPLSKISQKIIELSKM